MYFFQKHGKVNVLILFSLFVKNLKTYGMTLGWFWPLRLSKIPTQTFFPILNYLSIKNKTYKITSDFNDKKGKKNRRKKVKVITKWGLRFLVNFYILFIKFFSIFYMNILYLIPAWTGNWVFPIIVNLLILKGLNQYKNNPGWSIKIWVMIRHTNKNRDYYFINS